MNLTNFIKRIQLLENKLIEIKKILKGSMLLYDSSCQCCMKNKEEVKESGKRIRKIIEENARKR